VAEEPLRRRLRARALGLASRASGLVPRGLALGGLEGVAWLSRFSTFEERTRANLELALGDELSPAELARVAGGVRRHTARLAYEWLRLASVEDDRALHAFLDRTVTVDDTIERLERVLTAGRGAILVTAHLGNWELLAAAVRRRGISGAVVGLEKRRDPAAQWLVDLRRRYGVPTIPQHSHPRELVRVLESGGVLGLLCDLEVRRLAGEFLPFFGRPALTMTAPAALARARRVPLVPARCVLPAAGVERYRVSFEEPLEFDFHLPRREATRELMGRVNAVFEGWIREHPEQWAWHQHRWRTRPGELRAVPLHARD
jgi:KDO2-lipid IV(A) lauroyltransferase